MSQMAKDAGFKMDQFNEILDQLNQQGYILVGLWLALALCCTLPDDVCFVSLAQTKGSGKWHVQTSQY
jgi:hypothetical protein